MRSALCAHTPDADQRTTAIPGGQSLVTFLPLVTVTVAGVATVSYCLDMYVKRTSGTIPKFFLTFCFYLELLFPQSRAWDDFLSGCIPP